MQGQLPNGSFIAIKQLSSNSRQGNREFLNEMGMISCLQHPNLVTLHGCCIEGDQLLLVYEYMENNSLARALYGTSSVIFSTLNLSSIKSIIRIFKTFNICYDRANLLSILSNLLDEN